MFTARMPIDRKSRSYTAISISRHREMHRTSYLRDDRWFASSTLMVFAHPISSKSKARESHKQATVTKAQLRSSPTPLTIKFSNYIVNRYNFRPTQPVHSKWTKQIISPFRSPININFTSPSQGWVVRLEEGGTQCDTAWRQGLIANDRWRYIRWWVIAADGR